jgi:hypothetical protein
MIGPAIAAVLFGIIGAVILSCLAAALSHGIVEGASMMIGRKSRLVSAFVALGLASLPLLLLMPSLYRQFTSGSPFEYADQYWSVSLLIAAGAAPLGAFKWMSHRFGFSLPRRTRRGGLK